MKKNQPPRNDSSTSTVLRRLTRNALGLFGLAAGMALLPNLQAQIVYPLPINEPFAWSSGERLRTAGTSDQLWSRGNSAGTGSPVVTNAAALSYPGLQYSTNGLYIFGLPTSGRMAAILYSNQVFSAGNPTLYASMLISIVTNPPSTRFLVALDSSASTSTTGPSGTGGGNVAVGVFVDPLGRLQVAKSVNNSPTSPTTIPLAVGSTHLVVVRYKFVAGTVNDEVSLWLDPTSFGVVEGSVPSPTIATSANTDQASAQFFWVNQPLAANGNSGGAYFIDEVRVGTNWAQVTPPSCSPGTTFAMTGGGTNCNTASFPVGITGSQTGVDYWLITNGLFSGNIVSGNGSAIGFGNQTEDAIYTVLASNITTSCVGYMNGAAIVDILFPPTITTQPSTTVISTGGYGVISVAASGDALTYQWRRNGVNLTDTGHFSGTTTPNLVIYPANGADAATALNGYDCVITGVCTPNATSTRVAVTIKAPGNLVWQGETAGVSNRWDVASAANWIESAALTTFNFGDNVTFNYDTSFDTAALLSSPFLAPASITISGGALAEFRFMGDGSIVGTATTLTMNSPQMLIMNPVNSYGGGTIINQGTLSIDNNGALGSGQITLAGGTLNVSNALTLGNSVLLTASSTININNTSGSALVLTNVVGSTAGTLTINNNTAARGPTVRLSAPGFVLNCPIALELGGSGTNMFLAGYNASGDQVFNGIISGGGSIQRTVAGGTTILAANNTYNSRTDISDGTLLVNGQIVSTNVTMVDGTLGGSGSIGGPVTMIGGNLAPGNRAIGTLTINNNLTFTNNLAIEVNRSASPSNDLVSVSGVLTNLGVGTVTVTNLGATLQVGDSFKLFSQPLLNGSVLTITGVPGVTWTNKLQQDGTIAVLAVAPTQQPLITSAIISGSDFIISGTNGTAGTQYYLLSSGNLATALTGWTRESTNTFGVGGGFSVTTPYSVVTPQKFFVIQLP
jgi:autotransporter-associated beta strand protein